MSRIRILVVILICLTGLYVFFPTRILKSAENVESKHTFRQRLVAVGDLHGGKVDAAQFDEFRSKVHRY